jgi:hypothetical protein
MVERRSFDDRKTELEKEHRREVAELAASFAAPVMRTATELSVLKDGGDAAQGADEGEDEEDDDEESEDDDSDDDNAEGSNEVEH